MTKRLHLLWAFAAGVLLSSPVRAQTPPAASAPPLSTVSARAAKGQWRALLEEGERVGLPKTRLKVTTDRFPRAGIGPDAARPILQLAFDAARQGLPWEPMLTKIDEGILNRVGAEALALAAKGRAESLAKARAVIASALGSTASRDKSVLIPPVALALESGVSETVLADVLRQGSRKPTSQLKPVVEAGEALQLAGFEPEAVEALMQDCLSRNLQRPEVLRVVRFAVEKKRQGMAGMAVREALWDPTTKGEKAPLAAEPLKSAPAPTHSPGNP